MSSLRQSQRLRAPARRQVVEEPEEHYDDEEEEEYAEEEVDDEEEGFDNEDGDEGVGHVPNGSLSKLNQALLQYLVRNGFATEPEVTAYFQKVKVELYPSDASSLSDAIATINDSIRFLKLKIQVSTSEVSGEKFVILVDTKSVIDQGSKNISFAHFDNNQLNFYKALIDEIVINNNGKFTFNDYNCRPIIDASIRGEGLSIVERLIAHGWISTVEKHELGALPNSFDITLGERAMVELKDYIKFRWNTLRNDGPAAERDLPKCNHCHTPALLRVSCLHQSRPSRESCGGVFHRPCVLKERRNGAALKCPNCHVVWPSGRFLEERDPHEGARRDRAKQAIQQRKRKSIPADPNQPNIAVQLQAQQQQQQADEEGEQEGEGEGEGEQDDEEAPVVNRRASRGKRRRL